LAPERSSSGSRTPAAASSASDRPRDQPTIPPTKRGSP
jgi:hypothetical protein